MNRRRWIGVSLSAAWLAGIAGYEVADWRSELKDAHIVITPLCQQADEASRAKCIATLGDYFAHAATRHAVGIVVFAVLACLLGWTAGLLVIKRPSQP